jgi:hypothetical protein
MAGLWVLTDRESARVQSTRRWSSTGVVCEERPRLPVDGIRRQYLIKSLLRPAGGIPCCSRGADTARPPASNDLRLCWL